MIFPSVSPNPCICLENNHGGWVFYHFLHKADCVRALNGLGAAARKIALSGSRCMRSALAVAPVVAVDNNKDRDSSCSTPTITRRSLPYFSLPLFEVLRLQCAVLFFYQVYVGAPNIQDYAPGPHSYIDMRDFKTPSDLVAKLRELDSDDAQYQVRSFEVFRIILPCKLQLVCNECMHIFSATGSA